VTVSEAERWQFWIDRGGTFTDCLGLDPDTGEIHSAKVLSSDRAPLIGIRRILDIAADADIAPCEVRMGTTIATNALLERQGSDCALVITRGFADLLEIGNQTRTDLFALDIRKPELLYQRVIETSARLAADGSVLADVDVDALRPQLEDARASGIASLAVVVINSYRSAELERRIGELATEVGFTQVSLSAEVAAEIGMVGRGDTTVVDAYLTPLIKDYVATLLQELPGSSLHIMQSSGGLTEAEQFRGRNAILSGPAGGVVAYAHHARTLGMGRAIGFDMGGTSTDVSCFEGEFEREYETEVAGVRLRAPMMAINTVAAGGGSICKYNGFRMTVGPESAGATPGPLCYDHEDATELTVTDINLALGRVVTDRFPFQLNPERVDETLGDLAYELGMTPEALAAGFFDIANANMAEAIRQVSIARGRDVREYALMVFGGAGGQHACPVARELGIRTLVFHPLAGVLSAYGMGLADVSWHNEADAGQRPVDGDLLGQLDHVFDSLMASSPLANDCDVLQRVDLRYRGTESPITVEVSDDLRGDFERAHLKLFGYTRPDHDVEAVTARVEVLKRSDAANFTGVRTDTLTTSADRRAQMWTGIKLEWVPIYNREELAPGTKLNGPALVLDATGTIAIDPGFEFELVEDGSLIARDNAPGASRFDDGTAADPIRLEIFNNLFMSVATQMGNVLRRTALSTNIRERLDFSCAVFDGGGGLVANAPHVPVHLGAMGETVRAIIDAYPTPQPGDVYATNDPAAGGSHLPDVTVITPVHDDAGELLFFTASRGHHSDIGGITPGSMPPFSTALDQEGAVLRNLTIVKAGALDEAAVLAALTEGEHPARAPADNLADLQAQIAANRTGAALLEQLIASHGRSTVVAYMKHIQDNAAAHVAAEIDALADGEYTFEDALDDGTAIAVKVVVDGDTMSIDFSGTGEQVAGNLNAPRAVTVAATIYVLRALVGSSIPLNSGCLRPVTLTIPPGTVLSPAPDAAVAGGNVETSQRIVDTLLGALGKAAASQGTMNNLTFGTDSFGYYETICGGAGATANAPGASGVHTHMTNTRITDPEILESRFPVRLRQFCLRRGSGGHGAHAGGDGVVRELELLQDMRVSILSERRTRTPFGLAGGGPGRSGRNLHNDQEIPGKVTVDASSGDVIRIETPGGGGYGATDQGD